MAQKAEVQNRYSKRPEQGQDFVINSHYNVVPDGKTEPDVTAKIGIQYNGLNVEIIRHYKGGRMVQAGFTLDKEQALALVEFLQQEIKRDNWM